MTLQNEDRMRRRRLAAFAAGAILAVTLPLAAAEKAHDVTPDSSATDVVAVTGANDVVAVTGADDRDAFQGPTQNLSADQVASLSSGDSGGERTRGSAGVSVDPAGVGGPIANIVGCGQTVKGTLGTCTGANCFTSTQTGRVFRDGVASACSPAKACPGALSGGPFRYDVYTFDNASLGAVCNCITVSFNTGTCGAAVHATAFAGTYTAQPAWTCGVPNSFSYLGDVGSSLTQPFSFELPPGTTTYSLVFNGNTTTAPAGCTYTATISCGTTPSIACALLPIEAKLDALPCEILKALKPPKPGKSSSSSTGCP